MADESIYPRIEEVRKRLPNAYLVIVSNGDYLNRNSLRKLEGARVNRLLLDLYLTDGKERDATEIEREMYKFSKRTGRWAMFCALIRWRLLPSISTRVRAPRLIWISPMVPEREFL